MSRAFEPYLDMALTAARKPIMNETAIMQNIANGIHNAMSQVKPTRRASELAAEATQAGRFVAQVLAQAFFSLEDQDVKMRLASFEATMADLRSEMEKCPPSDMARIIGLE